MVGDSKARALERHCCQMLIFCFGGVSQDTEAACGWKSGDARLSCFCFWALFFCFCWLQPCTPAVPPVPCSTTLYSCYSPAVLPYLYTGNGHNSPAAADVVHLHRVQTFLQPFVRVSVASGMHPPAWRGRGAVAFRARRVSVKPEGGGADYPQSAGRFRLR